MLDFHAHVLPEADDGAKNIDESIQMLRMLYSQGADTIVATPHFYPQSMDISRFFERRQKSLSMLLTALDETKDARPNIAMGAEVFFYPTIYNFDELEGLCIEGTKYLLLEMPFKRWEKDDFGVIKNIISKREIIPIIAHIDRYFKYGNGKKEAEILKDSGALIQVNCEAFYHFFARKKVFSMVKSSLADVLGTDCHNMSTRQPKITPALETVIKKLGHGALINFEEKSKNILKNAVLY